MNDLESVKVAGNQIIKTAKEGKVDVLICNAGIFVPPTPGVTKQGYEQAFGVNREFEDGWR